MNKVSAHRSLSFYSKRTFYETSREVGLLMVTRTRGPDWFNSTDTPDFLSFAETTAPATRNPPGFEGVHGKRFLREHGLPAVETRECVIYMHRVRGRDRRQDSPRQRTAGVSPARNCANFFRPSIIVPQASRLHWSTYARGDRF